MSNVTMKSTKQEIMDALKEAQAKLNERKTVISEDVSTKLIERADAAIAQAKEDVENSYFSDSMNEKFTNLQEAITAMEQKLSDMYGIEKEYQHIEMITNAAKVLHLQMEEESAKRKAVADQQKVDIAANIENTRYRLEEEERARQNSVKIAREREEEEYRYEISRKRKAEQDEYDDKMAEANKRLDEVKAEAQSITEEINSRKEEIDELIRMEKEMPEKLAAEYERGLTDGEKAAGKEYGYKKSMAEKEHEYQIRERDNNISRLENMLDEKCRKVECLEEKLDAAYVQLRELATKTVESNGGIKVLNGDMNTNKR